MEPMRPKKIKSAAPKQSGASFAKSGSKAVPGIKVKCFACRHLDGRDKCQKYNKWLERWETKKERTCASYSKKPESMMPKKKSRKYSTPKESREEVIRRIIEIEESNKTQDGNGIV